MKNKIFLDGPRAPRPTIFEKNSGALGTRMDLDQRVCFVYAGNLKFQFLSLRGPDIFLVADFRVFRRKTHLSEMVYRKKNY